MQNENNDHRTRRRNHLNHTAEESEEEANTSKWTGLELLRNIKNLSPKLWSLNFLTCLRLNDNGLTRIPAEIGKLTCLKKLDLSSNLINLTELYLNHNSLYNLPHELGRLFQIQILGLDGNPLSQEVLSWNSQKNGSSELISMLLDNLSGQL